MSNADFPARMKAVEITKDADKPALVVGEIALPDYGPDDVLIRVAASGVNRPDLMQVAGMYPPPPGASEIPGLELAGEIVAIGSNVTDWACGDKVCALVTGGGYAQYAAVPAAQCLPVPDGLTMTQAAGLPETFFTVWHNVFDKAALKTGETFLVHGGTSGIGTTAIQLAKAFGAKVIATAGSQEKCQACRDLGADVAINYKTEDFVEQVKAATDGKGANVILDMVAGDYVSRNFKAAAFEARILIIAFLRGPKAETNFTPLLLKRLTLMGSTLRAQPVANKAAIANALREKVWPLIEAGKIAPVIYKTVPLDQASEAHAILKGGAHIGKVILEVD
ncbi:MULTISPECIES: NAD(P)H-quinone oxidoreductase [Thalassospira]|jgi:NADPH:quinone reductase|uniref:NAD(P)H-quinone oxidoreductase n=1 Tax=Thalassospira TaxID=168934 RepID=UPI00201B53A8|nr:MULTISPECIES: NAD(P)H-quinone oxidoreductase [Thalassospira]|tara:strand:+ start:3386 stop:4393 length:1008 start_codon:yes stop_codon:yes gene_type:complete